MSEHKKTTLASLSPGGTGMQGIKGTLHNRGGKKEIINPRPGRGMRTMSHGPWKGSKQWDML